MDTYDYEDENKRSIDWGAVAVHSIIIAVLIFMLSIGIISAHIIGKAHP